MHYLWVSQTTLFSHFFIKNGSHGTIHTFKNYFATVFFSFQFSTVSKWTLSFHVDWKLPREIVSESMTLSFRDGNLYPTREYPARPDPNGPDFTWLDKL